MHQLLQVGLLEYQLLQVGLLEYQLLQVGLLEYQLLQVGLLEYQLLQVGLLEYQLLQVGLLEYQLLQVGLLEYQLLQVGLLEYQLLQVGLLEYQLLQVGLLEYQLLQVGLLEYQLLQVGLLRVLATIGRSARVLVTIGRSARVLVTIGRSAKSISCYRQVCQSISYYRQVCQSISYYRQVCQSISYYRQVCQSISYYRQVCQSISYNRQVCQSISYYRQVCQSISYYRQVCQSSRYSSSTTVILWPQCRVFQCLQSESDKCQCYQVELVQKLSVANQAKANVDQQLQTTTCELNRLRQENVARKQKGTEETLIHTAPPPPPPFPQLLSISTMLYILVEESLASVHCSELKLVKEQLHKVEEKNAETGTRLQESSQTYNKNLLELEEKAHLLTSTLAEEVAGRKAAVEEVLKLRAEMGGVVVVCQNKTDLANDTERALNRKLEEITHECSLSSCELKNIRFVVCVCVCMCICLCICIYVNVLCMQVCMCNSLHTSNTPTGSQYHNRRNNWSPWQPNQITLRAH